MSSDSSDGYPVAVVTGPMQRRRQTRLRRNRARPVGLIVLALALALVAAGCADTEEGPVDTQSGDNTVSAEDAAAARSEIRPQVTLGVTGWTGAEVTTAIAEVIIERRLGYPVEIASIEDTGSMLDRLAGNELDAVLEVWPSNFRPGEDIRAASGEVTTLGPLGAVARTGWFVPDYVIEQHPELGTWEGFASDAAAQQFSSEETGGRARFLGTEPDWEQHDEDLITGLDLPFEVFYSGSEAATITELEEAIGLNQPILLYWWSPSSEVVRYDLVRVELPPRTAECDAAAEAGEPDLCGYPEEPIEKLGAADLAQRRPDLYRFLSEFSLTTEDQLALIDQVDNRGVSIRAAAESWVDNNSDRWERWLEQ